MIPAVPRLLGTVEGHAAGHLQVAHTLTNCVPRLSRDLSRARIQIQLSSHLILIMYLDVPRYFLMEERNNKYIEKEGVERGESGISQIPGHCGTRPLESDSDRYYIGVCMLHSDRGKIVGQAASRVRLAQSVAARIPRAPQPSQTAKRVGRQLSPGAVRRAAPADWVVVSVSVSPDRLRQWDAMVEACRSARVSMSRSRLLQIAMAALDLESVIRPRGAR